MGVDLLFLATDFTFDRVRSYQLTHKSLYNISIGIAILIYIDSKQSIRNRYIYAIVNCSLVFQNRNGSTIHCFVLERLDIS